MHLCHTKMRGCFTHNTSNISLSTKFKLTNTRPLNACLKSQSHTLYTNIDIHTKWLRYVNTHITNFNSWRLVQCCRPSPRAWAPSTPMLFPWRLYVWTTKHTDLSTHVVIHAPPHQMNALACKNPCCLIIIAYMSNIYNIYYYYRSSVAMVLPMHILANVIVPH